MKINGISQGYIGILLFVALSGTAMVFYLEEHFMTTQLLAINFSTTTLVI